MTSTTPTIVTVPCFSGAPWELDQLTPLADHRLTTMRLPHTPDSIEAYADVVAAQVAGLDDYVLVGDSFGAVVALAFATRRPSGLRALVLSGGFAADPITDRVTKAKVAMSRFLPGPLYRQIVLRFHAASLASPHDLDGQVPWTRADSRHLFVDNTPHAAYVNRARAAFSADYRDQLADIDVPTLILTPSHDELIGEQAARVMLDGIPDATETVLDDTGHMFRFSHPVTYASAIRNFLATHGLSNPTPDRRCPHDPRTTHHTIQAHLNDQRRDAAHTRRPHLPNTPRNRPMLTFTNTIDIAQPIGEVFTFIEDFTHIPLWNYWVQHVTRDTDGPIRVGTLFHQTRRDDHQTYQVIDHRPGRRVTVTTLDGHRPAFTRTITLDPVTGGTRITDDWELDTGHPPLLQRLAGTRIRDGLATNLAKLKELLENGRTVLPDGRTTRIDHGQLNTRGR